jgi:Ca-activated chloride channel homolog
VIRLAYPAVLLVTPLVLGLLWLALAWAAKRRRTLVEKFTGDPKLYWSSPGFSGFRQKLERGLLLSGVAFLLVALARPMAFFKDDQHELQGIPYLIAIDASRSMLATDVKPTRYGAVTNALDKWLAETAADRIGIITFAGEAYLNAPLTFDSSALRAILRYMEPESLTEGGSSIKVAIERAQKYFTSNALPQRILIVISDGEELDGNAIEATRRARRQSGLLVSTIGVGTGGGAKVPAKRRNWEQPRLQKNAFGQEVVSRLDEGNLKRIANAGGGKYFALGANGEGLEQLRELVLRPIAENAAKDNLQNYRDVFQIPLALGLLCLAMKLIFRAENVQRRPAQKPQPAIR